MLQDFAMSCQHQIQLLRRRSRTKESCSTTASSLENAWESFSTTASISTTASSCPPRNESEDHLEEQCEPFWLEGDGRRVSTTSTITSNGLYSEPAQTLIFLDWDDTLFPTTELIDKWAVPSHWKDWGDLYFTEEQEEALSKWRMALHDFLCTASALSDRCVIVTNAKRPWVEECVSHFAPDLWPLLFNDRSSAPLVIYAREVFDAQAAKRKTFRDSLVPARKTERDADGNNDARMKAWKYAAMRREAENFYAQYQGQTWKNILSLGDMHYEYHALQDLAFRRCGPARERLRTKAVVVPDRLSMTSLTFELRTWQLLLPALVCVDGDVDVNLASLPREERPGAVSAGLHMPALDGLMRLDDATPEEEACSMLDELAQVVQAHLIGD